MSTQRRHKPPVTDPGPRIPNRPFPLKFIVAVLTLLALGTALGGLMWPKPAQALDVIGLEPQETARVKAAQTYLNALKSIKSRFLQVTSQGAFAEGTLWISRPGKLRIDYDPPVQVQIISDGDMLLYKDLELDQNSYVPLSSTPASLIVAEDIDFFADNLMITDFERADGVLRLSLSRTDDPQEGIMTLVFSERPFQLKKWTIIDAQGVVTTVSLLGPDFNAKVNAELFKLEQRILKRNAD